MFNALFGTPGERRAQKNQRIRRAHRAEQIGQWECLESRALLSTVTFPRIINGEVISEASPRIINGTPTSGFAAVGEVGDRSGGFCSGTLIAPQYVLTAGHCGEGLAQTAGRFFLGGSTYSTSHVFMHPQFNGNLIGTSDAANDLSIFQLSTPVSGVTPDPIFRGTPHVGDVLTLVGFGGGGTGNTGSDGSFGTKRMGTTPLDGLTAGRVLWTFDNNTESNTAPGDSGGPAYELVNGVYYIEGVTSGGTRANAGIGDHSFDTRVDAYAEWIDSVVSNTPPPPPPPPPPPGPDDHPNAPGPDATAIAVAADGTFHASGSLEVAGDRDVFKVDVTSGGAMTVSLTSVSLSLDTYLRVYDSAGNLLAFDDDSGPGTDSRLTTFVSPGTYYVSAGSWIDAGTGDYLVDGSIVADDHGDTFSTASDITLGAGGDASASGNIERAGDRDFFRFVATRNGLTAIDLHASASSVDTILNVYDFRGRRIAFNDDTAPGTDSHVAVRLRAGSTYFIGASSYGVTEGKYSLHIAPTTGPRHGGSGRSTLNFALGRSIQVGDAPASSSSSGTEGTVLTSAHSASPANSFAAATQSQGEECDGRISRHHSTLADLVDHVLSDEFSAGQTG